MDKLQQEIHKFHRSDKLKLLKEEAKVHFEEFSNRILNGDLFPETNSFDTPQEYTHKLKSKGDCPECTRLKGDHLRCERHARLCVCGLQFRKAGTFHQHIKNNSVKQSTSHQTLEYPIDLPLNETKKLGRLDEKHNQYFSFNSNYWRRRLIGDLLALNLQQRADVMFYIICCKYTASIFCKKIEKALKIVPFVERRVSTRTEIGPLLTTTTTTTPTTKITTCSSPASTTTHIERKAIDPFTASVSNTYSTVNSSQDPAQNIVSENAKNPQSISNKRSREMKEDQPQSKAHCARHLNQDDEGIENFSKNKHMVEPYVDADGDVDDLVDSEEEGGKELHGNESVLAILFSSSLIDQDPTPEPPRKGYWLLWRGKEMKMLSMERKWVWPETIWKKRYSLWKKDSGIYFYFFCFEKKRDFLMAYFTFTIEDVDCDSCILDEKKNGPGDKEEVEALFFNFKSSKQEITKLEISEIIIKYRQQSRFLDPSDLLHEEKYKLPLYERFWVVRVHEVSHRSPRPEHSQLSKMNLLTATKIDPKCLSDENKTLTLLCILSSQHEMTHILLSGQEQSPTLVRYFFENHKYWNMDFFHALDVIEIGKKFPYMERYYDENYTKKLKDLQIEKREKRLRLLIG